MEEKNRAVPFRIKLADIVVGIEPIYSDMEVYCREYITEETADFNIKIEESDIDFERVRSKKEAEKEGREVVEYSDSYLETLAVYRQIAEKLPMYNTFLFHGSAIAVDDRGYLFTAKSGTGKSTHTRLWREYFGERAIMVNDDKPLLKVSTNGVRVYGTPWDGKHRLSNNVSVQLKAVCILVRDDVNHIEEISAGEAYQMLLQQSYRPLDKKAVVQTLTLLDILKEHVKFYRLGCNMDPEAAKVAYCGMNGGCI